MAIKNHVLKSLRLEKETADLLEEASEKTGFKKTDLTRYLLTRALKQLKADSISAKGYENLEFTIRHI